MIYFIIWYILGLIGCGLLIRDDYNNGRSVNLMDIIFSLLMGFGGFIMLLVAIREAGYVGSLGNKIESIIVIKHPEDKE